MNLAPVSKDPFADQTVSRAQQGKLYGLDTIGSAVPRVLESRTVSGYMKRLTVRLSKEPAFKGVTFSEDYPDEAAETPRVIWQLEGREAGIDGHNKKNPYRAQEIPTEDGTIIQKFDQPNSFSVAFQIFTTESDQADYLALVLESFLVLNGYVIGQCGADAFYFTSEGPHGQYKVGGSQRLKQRTLHYFGTLNQTFVNEVGRVQSIRVWNPTNNVAIQTVAITRSGIDQADEFPVLGPLVLVCLHTQDDKVSEDYLYNVDYNLIIDQQKFGHKFYINWFDKGKNPDAETTYYASFVQPGDGNVDSRLITEDNSNPGNLRLPPGTIRRVSRGAPFARRQPILARVLGQEVDLENPARGRTILFLNSQNVVETPGVSTSLLEAITRANFQVVSVIDSSVLPIDPGTAFSPS